MNDGLNSAADASFLPRRMIRLAGMLFFLVNLFAGCSIPVSRTTIVPKDVAQTPEQLIGKLDLLKTGMEMGEEYYCSISNEPPQACGKSSVRKKSSESCMAPPN